MRTVNLYEETISELYANGASPQDVRYVTDGYTWSTWEDFVELAKKVHYPNQYGSVIISKDLKVVGDHFWLERHSAGSIEWAEWWEFKTLPTKPEEQETILNFMFED